MMLFIQYISVIEVSSSRPANDVIYKSWKFFFQWLLIVQDALQM
jgi:hypothetical protein